MDTVAINNLIVGKSAISAVFNEPLVVGVYARNYRLVDEFLDTLAGLNPTQGKITYNNEDVFDNANYFQKRLLFNFAKPCVSTLRTNYLKDQIATNWELTFDENKFKKLVKELSIRSEVSIDYHYCFTKAGNTLTNYATVKALDKSLLLIKNPTVHLNSFEQIDPVVSGLTDKNASSFVFLGMENLKNFAGKLDYVILIGNEQTVIVNPKLEKMMAVSGEENLQEVVFRGEVNITRDVYDKAVTRLWDKQKRSYQRISVFDIEVFR